MKTNLVRLLTLALALIVLISTVGCGKSDTSSGVDDAVANDDFFADDETEITDDGDTNEQTGEDDGNKSGTSKTGNKKSTGKKNSVTGDDGDSGETKKTENKKSSNTKKEVPKENKIAGKSAEDVLNSVPKKLRGTTVTMYNWNPASEYTGAPTVIQEFEKKTNINVEWKTINFEVYTTRLASLIASGESPDLVRTRTPSATRLISFQPLSTTNYNFSDDAWDQILMKDYSVNGVAYATSLKNTHLGSVAMMFYNKSLITRFDLDNPYKLWKDGKWTVSKFLKMCKEYKKVSNESFACVGWTYAAWNQLYGVAGPVGFDGKKYYSNIKNNKYLTSTMEIADLFNSSKLCGEGRAEIFDEGRALFYAGASVYARRKNSYFGAVKAAGSFYAVPMPKVDGQSTYYQPRDEYEAYAIAKGAKNPEAVPYFLRYFLDGSNYDLSGFFCNKQNLEVYNWCMSQKNTIWSLGDGGENFNNRENGIYSKQGNQVKSFIDSNSSEIDEMVKRYNTTLGNLSK